MVGAGPGRERGVLRVVSYNLHGLRDDRAELVTTVRELAPDVLVVQEAPWRWRWRYRCAALARAVGMVAAAGGGPGVGNLLLTTLRVAVPRARIRRFPLTPGRHLRAAVFADCRLGRRPFRVVGTHLATGPAERVGQARLLADWLTVPAVAEGRPDDRDPPLVLAGDLNDEPGGPAWRLLARGRVDTATATDGSAATFPADDPRRRIDAVFVDPAVTVLAHRVVDTPAARRASDHLPVVADLRLPD